MKAAVNPQPAGARQQRVEVVRVVVSHAVDEEPWSPVDAAADAAHEVLADALGVDVLVELAFEPLGVEPEAVGVGEQALSVQPLLVLIQKVVHRPEPVLRGCRLRSLRGLRGVRMCRRDREVAKDEAKLVSHRFLYLLDDRIRGAAVGAFVVAVLEERHGCVRRSLNMVASLCHGQRERGFPGRSHEGSSSSARRIPSAPGLTPTGDT